MRPVASSALVCSPGGPGHRPLFEDIRNASKGSASLLPQVINLQGQTPDTHTCHRTGLGSWAARVGASTSRRWEAFQALFPKEFPAGESPKRRRRGARESLSKVQHLQGGGWGACCGVRGQQRGQMERGVHKEEPNLAGEQCKEWVHRRVETRDLEPKRHPWASGLLCDMGLPQGLGWPKSQGDTGVRDSQCGAKGRASISPVQTQHRLKSAQSWKDFGKCIPTCDSWESRELTEGERLVNST